MSRALNLLLCGAMLAAAGCKKDNDHTDVTFVNRVNDVITLDIYGSQQNYFDGTGRLMRKVLKYNEKIVLSKDELPSNITYFADWYNDNHYYNNWFNDATLPDKAFVSFKPTPGNNTYYLEPTLKGKAAQILLNGDSVLTRWKAVNAYIGTSQAGYTSVWDGLTDNEKVRDVTVRKNFTALYSYINSTGVPTTETLSFKVHNFEEAYIEFMDANNASIGQMLSGYLPTSTAPQYVSTSTDTIMAEFPHAGDYFYMMVKQ
jgi:hypothetical protein